MNPKFARFIPLVVLLFILTIFLGNSTFLTIDPGHKGIIFKRFGKGLDKEKIYDQGFHFIFPWNKMFIYDVRIQEHYEKMSVLSKNGLNIEIDLTFRFYPQRDQIGNLHDEVGQSFLKKIIIPEIRSATREVIGKYLPEELYSTKRESIQEEILTITKNKVQDKYLVIDDVLIREVNLPKTLQDAIERKLKEEQLSLEYEFRLDRERKEAERKVIEARAKAEANQILNASLTDKILEDKGIEATLELSKSPNSKVVVVGGTKNGLPLILNN